MGRGERKGITAQPGWEFSDKVQLDGKNVFSKPSVFHTGRLFLPEITPNFFS